MASSYVKNSYQSTLVEIKATNGYKLQMNWILEPNRIPYYLQQSTIQKYIF